MGIMEYVEIVRPRDRAVLYLRDGCNHVQWMTPDTIDLGLDNEHCETCEDYGIRRSWRRVYVKA